MATIPATTLYPATTGLYPSQLGTTITPAPTRWEITPSTRWPAVSAQS